MLDETVPLLTVDGLQVTLGSGTRAIHAVRGASFQVLPGHTLGLVGESGCGKSVSAKAILGILPAIARVTAGTARFQTVDGTMIDLAAQDPKSSAFRSLRGSDIAMVFQEPMSSFSAVHTIGAQIAEVVLTHEAVSRAEARRRAIETMDMVGIPNPASRFDAYAYELSGGLRQRAMIATALVGRPRLLLADEPTTALDVTTQAQILDLLKDLQAQLGMGTVLVTHDLAVIANNADHVAVMYLGRVVESGPVRRIFAQPSHPYTQGLIGSVAALDLDRHAPLNAIRGSVPDPSLRVTGCAFAARCDQAIPGICDRTSPPVVDMAEGHRVECHLYVAAAGAMA